MLVKVVGVKRYKDRHGKERLYYRRKGCPTVALDATLSGTELAAEVNRLDKLYKPFAIRANTLRSLETAYKAKSNHWRGLRQRTRDDYERVFKLLGAAMDFTLSTFTPPVIAGLRDKARDENGFKFANQVLATLNSVFSFGVEYGHVPLNPVSEISKIARPTDLPEANRPWTPEEAVELMRAPIHLKGPIAMAAYLALREGDILKMSKDAITDRLLKITTSKTRRSLELPVCDDLWSILLAYRKWRTALWEAKRERAKKRSPLVEVQDLVTTMFVNSKGGAWTEDGFRTSWGKWRDQLKKAKKIGEGVTFHGGRHTVATVLAECDFDPQQVKHLLGHGSETMTEHYQRRAKRRGMLKDMTEAVQKAYRLGGENVVQLGRLENGSD